MNRAAVALWLPMVAVGLLWMTTDGEAFSMPFTSNRRPTLVKRSHIHYMIPSPTEFTVEVSSDYSFSSLILAEESWRQYVALLLIGGVLMDILLGSPIANLALKPLRGKDQEPGEDSNKNPAQAMNKSRERIDSDAVAKAAIERAQNTLELRRFLEEQKTDWDRMEEMKRKLDAEMQELDEDLRAREESLKRKSQ